MSTRPTKKERERLLLETFLRIERIASKIVDREAPDFEITIEDRTVGVEVTEIHQPTGPGEVPLQAIASITREIVERAERLYRDSSSESLRVSVAFSSNARLRSIRRDEAASLLLQIVQSTLIQPGKDLEWRPTNRQDLHFAELFSRVHIYRQPNDYPPHWLVVTAGWVAPLTMGLLQERIDEKSRRIAEYRNTLPEVWLLLAVRGDGPSQFFEFDTAGLDGSWKSPFQRTYFLDAFLGRTRELRSASVTPNNSLERTREG